MTRKLVVALTVMALLISAVPAAVAKVDEKNRPVKDWHRDKRDPIENGLEANGQNAFLPNFWDFQGPGYWLAGGFAPYGCGMTDEVVKAVDGKTKIEGKITERELPDGRAEVLVDIQVRNSPLTLFRNFEMFAWLDACFGPADPIPLPAPIAGAGADGSLDYHLELVMIIPEPGAVIVNWLSVVNGFIPPPHEVTYYKIEAEGTATFTGAVAGGPEGFVPGDTAEAVFIFEVIEDVTTAFFFEVTAQD